MKDVIRTKVPREKCLLGSVSFINIIKLFFFSYSVNQPKIANQVGSWRPDDFEIFDVEKNLFDPVDVLVSCLPPKTTTTTTTSLTTTKLSTIAKISTYSQENQNEPTHCPPKVRIFT